jgi:hypothetical protein
MVIGFILIRYYYLVRLYVLPPYYILNIRKFMKRV